MIRKGYCFTGKLYFRLELGLEFKQLNTYKSGKFSSADMLITNPWRAGIRVLKYRELTYRFTKER